jgi:hypothetical protein
VTVIKTVCFAGEGEEVGGADGLYGKSQKKSKSREWARNKSKPN